MSSTSWMRLNFSIFIAEIFIGATNFGCCGRLAIAARRPVGL
jgi:hypothetical protein